MKPKNFFFEEDDEEYDDEESLGVFYLAVASLIAAVFVYTALTMVIEYGLNNLL